MASNPQHIADGLNAIYEAMIETICRVGIPENKYDIPAGISLRLGRKLRHIDAKYGQQP
jgi:hypothetical protein